MWTRKTAILSSICISAALGAMIFVDYQLLVICIIFALILCISYTSNETQIELLRYLPEPKTFEGDQITVHLKITNKGYSSGLIEVYDKLPTTVKLIKGSNHVYLNLRKNESLNIKYTIECPLRGYYLLGPVILRKRDFFNIFCDKKVIMNRSYLTVYPRAEEVRQLPIQSRYRKVHPGMLTLRQLGFGTEFHSIRDYIKTDPFKKINWKATAKLNRLMVNQFEIEDVFDVMIFLDARAITKVGSTLRNPLEFGVKAAATLAMTFIKRTNRVGLVTYGEKVRIIKPGSGETHLATIMSTLTGTYAMGKTSFKTAVDTATPFLTPRSPIILISPIDDDDTIKPTMRDLSAKNFHVSVLSPSSIDFEREVDGYFSPKYLMIKLERENRLAELRGYGGKVIDWTPDKPLGEIVREVRG
jgi:uncharacterized protein (DUF58 family)